MRAPLSLLVRAGTLISAGVWNAMAAAVRSQRLVAGPGVRLRMVADGTVITFDAGSQTWLHAWKVTLTDTGARIRPGLINGVEATILGKPLQPVKESDPAPQLEWTRPKLDQDGRGWIAAECALGKDWEVQKGKVEIVQVADLDKDEGQKPAKDAPTIGYSGGGTLTLPGRRARAPLAMIRQREDGRLVLFQIAYFNLRHRVAVQSATSEVGRHFFPAA